MKGKSKLGFGILTSLVVLMLFVSFVGAYGIASPYWKGHPLTIAPGDTKTVSITLQQPVSEEDIVVDVKLKKGSEIASIREGTYDVEAGTKDMEVLVTVSVPEDVPLGTMYEVVLSSSEVTQGTGGGVSLGFAIDTTFDVVVGDVPKTEQPKNYNLLIVSALLILAILVVIVIIAYRKKLFRKK